MITFPRYDLNHTIIKFFVAQSSNFKIPRRYISASLIIPPTKYEGPSSYYTQEGENEETLALDSLKIAKSVAQLKKIPDYIYEWGDLARQMYREGVPYQVNREIYDDGMENPVFHPVLNYYLDLAGGFEPVRHKSDGREIYNTALIVGDVVKEWRQEHEGNLPHPDDVAGWNSLQRQLEHYFVSPSTAKIIRDEGIAGGVGRELSYDLNLWQKLQVDSRPW